MSHVTLFDPSDPLFTRPSMSRLFCAVRAVETDGAGRAVSGEAFYLDNVGGRVGWQAWTPGHVIHWHPFKLKLNHTPRAGLHVTSEWSTPSGEMRYGSNFMLRQEGVFVLNPSCVLEAGEPLGDAVHSPYERSLVDMNLRIRFGLSGDFRTLAALWQEMEAAPAAVPARAA